MAYLNTWLVLSPLCLCFIFAVHVLNIMETILTFSAFFSSFFLFYRREGCKKMLMGRARKGSSSIKMPFSYIICFLQLKAWWEHLDGDERKSDGAKLRGEGYFFIVRTKDNVKESVKKGSLLPGIPFFFIICTLQLRSWRKHRGGDERKSDEAKIVY